MKEQWILVESSNLEAVLYNKQTEQLHIRFRKSKLVYTYAGVPKEVYEGLINSDSVGSYFYSNIRNEYSFTTS